MFAPIWNNLQVHQECPCPPKIREETWRTGVVLTWFLTSDLDKTFTYTSYGCPIWHHLYVHLKCPFLPRLQEETWRTGGFLTWLLTSDHDKTFSDTYDECSLPSDTISSSIRNVYILLDSGKRLEGQVESWHGSSCQILMQLSQIQGDFLVASILKLLLWCLRMVRDFDF